jgi:hypothetical protein
MKIAVVGPGRSRKSALVSVLVGQREAIISDSSGPTVGVRILETSRPLAGGMVDVELWDVGSDGAYENCWPAVRDGVDGILLVADADAPGALKELQLWHGWFVTQLHMEANRVACIALRGGEGGPSLPQLSGVPVEAVSVGNEDAGAMARRVLDRLVSRLGKLGPR